jgi:Domain of unknown function (DUF4232)
MQPPNEHTPSRRPTLRCRPRPRAVVSAVAILVCSAGLAVPATGVAASTRVCSPRNLRLDKVGESDFTSHRGWNFVARNVASRTCHLKGYAAVRLLDAHASAMPTIVGHFGGPAHTVVLAPWHRAFFSVTFAVSGPCPGALFAYGMRFVPPGASSGLVWYAGRFDLCGPGPAVVNVSPFAFPRQF